MERSNSPCLAPAIQWGINYEDNARKEYIAKASEEYENFTCAMAGLHVLPSCPHLGASPDGMIACECCGEGLIEIKCTYKYRDVDPNGIHDPSFYLERSETEHLQLSRTHQYYHQVQAQLHVALCEKEFCDFICWTPHGMYIERILLDPSYLTKTKPKLDAFFVKVILPLLLTGRSSVCDVQLDSQTSISSQHLNTLTAKSSSQTDCTAPTYCWCGKEESRKMIACDNPECELEWFHYECVGLKRKPRGKWFCCNACIEANNHTDSV